MKKMYRRVLGAVEFLTILTLPGKEELEGAPAFFPLAGWLVGGALLLMGIATRSLPVLVRAFVIVAVWELASRGLHADALADTADALMAGGTKERILGIMDDTRIGAFGVLSIVLLISGKLALVSSVPYKDLGYALLTACVLGRTAPTLLAFVFPPAKDEGLGQMMISTTAWKELLVALILGPVAPVFFFGRAAVWSLSAFAVPLLLGVYCWRKLGGLTGDVMGASVELTELVVLLVFVIVTGA